jgi:hypothetical protein
MDEARRVIERLGRIDALRSAGAEPRALLVELRELVREGQAWAGVEGSGTSRAAAALGALDAALGDEADERRKASGREVMLRNAGH